MKRQVLFCHPENHDLTFTGYGRQPAWLVHYLDNGGMLEDTAVAAVAAGHRLASDLVALGIKVPVTEKLPVVQVEDQAQLPGLPPIPKKRGRPVTGQAMTPAERKRKSRRDTRVTFYDAPQEAGLSTLLEALAFNMRGGAGAKAFAQCAIDELQRRVNQMPSL